VKRPEKELGTYVDPNLISTLFAYQFSNFAHFGSLQYNTGNGGRLITKYKTQTHTHTRIHVYKFSFLLIHTCRLQTLKHQTLVTSTLALSNTLWLSTSASRSSSVAIERGARVMAA
jgi:hypothetical protein